MQIWCQTKGLSFIWICMHVYMYVSVADPAIGTGHPFAENLALPKLRLVNILEFTKLLN